MRLTPVLLQQKRIKSQKSNVRSAWQVVEIAGRSLWTLSDWWAQARRNVTHTGTGPTHCKHSLMQGSNPGTHTHRCRKTHTYKHLNVHTPGRQTHFLFSQFTFHVDYLDAGQPFSLEIQLPSWSVVTLEWRVLKKGNTFYYKLKSLPFISQPHWTVNTFSGRSVLRKSYLKPEMQEVHLEQSNPWLPPPLSGANTEATIDGELTRERKGISALPALYVYVKYPQTNCWHQSSSFVSFPGPIVTNSSGVWKLQCKHVTTAWLLLIT